MTAPPKLIELVENFDYNRAEYTATTYNEDSARNDFIDPFFECLGWDVNNIDGKNEAWRDVLREHSIKSGPTREAPDYLFKIGKTNVFIVEAKKPAVSIDKDRKSALQARTYGWNMKLGIAVLTNFREFAAYDCRQRPKKTDKAGAARILYYTHHDYVKKWDELHRIFARQSVERGELDRFIESEKKRGTLEVDQAFLQEIEEFRKILASNIALRNPTLSQRELNFAVQVTIDRIIFLRICEDRGIEPPARIMALLNRKNIYKGLFKIFEDADDRYNSGLFHFTEEKGRASKPDTVTSRINIDDEKLKKIIKALYENEYDFSLIPVEILGQIYERFLGNVIYLTPGHQAKVQEKPEVKKAGGVYYTPSYIVDYIVENTVGKLLENKTPNQVAKIKILDPACGSGSFLLGAFQKLMEWHLEYYSKNPGKNQKKIFPVIGGGHRLFTAEKKRILLNNIYGVDIDPQAVEVTKLSLLLKILEGESEESINKQLKLFQERALPDLGDNIKCGNSLIGPDFYSGKPIDMFDQEELYKINAFDWKQEFNEVFKGKSPGFDAVIGNPPYVRQEGLGDNKDYFSRKYDAYHGMADLYTYFIEQAMNLLTENGHFGYIVSNKWMRANYGKPLRKWLKQQDVIKIVDFGDLPVFQNATTYPCLLFMTKGKAKKEMNSCKVKTLDFTALAEYVDENQYTISIESLNSEGWSMARPAEHRLIEKIKAAGTPLGEYVGNKVFYGIKTGLNEAFVIGPETRERLISEDPKSAEVIKPFLTGKDIKRYKPPDPNKFLILIPRGWTLANCGKKNPWNFFSETYPSLAKHLKQFKQKAEKRYDKGDFWWELRACEYYGEFEKPKIILPDISTRGNFTMDMSNCYTVNTSYIIPVEDPSLLGILNSKLITFFYSNLTSSIRGNYYRFIYQYIIKIPVAGKNKEIGKKAKQMLDLHDRLSKSNTPHEQDLIKRQIDATDKEIDSLVYELYGLTEEEIRIVEEGVKG